MKSSPLVKLEPADLAVTLQRAEVSDDSKVALQGVVTVAAAIEALTNAGLLLDAVRLMSHALPKREAVWWACMTARHTSPSDLPRGDVDALEAAELWVRRPTDENRRAAFALAQTAGFRSPEAWAAVAAFWSGDSMAPLGQPVVPPGPHLTGAAVAGSVILGSVPITPALQPQRLGRFLASGHDIAAGGPGRLPPESA